MLTLHYVTLMCLQYNIMLNYYIYITLMQLHSVFEFHYINVITFH